MRIIAKKTLRVFWEQNPDCRPHLESWYSITLAADWPNPAALKRQFRNASILKDSRAVFNIKGNDYRLIVKINYPYRIVYVRFLGTHQAYDAIDAEVI
jgi:mRNA interferase HigB